MIKIRNFLYSLLLFVLLLGFSSPVLAQTDPPPTIQGDKIVVGQTFILKEDQTLNGDLVVIGGTAILKSHATVNGDVVLIGGVMDVFGTIDGDVTALGGSLDLMDTAFLSGSLIKLWQHRIATGRRDYSRSANRKSALFFLILKKPLLWIRFPSRT